MPTPLEKARALAPVIEREAPAGERTGTMPSAVVDALDAAGMFRLMVPQVLGGAEVDAVTAIEVLEEICRIDGSTGWSLLANVTSTAFAASYCSDAAVKEMFDGSRPAIHAGQFALRARVRTGRRRCGTCSPYSRQPLTLRSRRSPRWSCRSWRTWWSAACWSRSVSAGQLGSAGCGQ